MKNKLELISKKLISLGYQKLNFIKEHESIKDDDVFKEIKEIMINNTPDIMFHSNDFDINFFFKENLFKIESLGKLKEITDSCVEIQQSVPFNQIKMDDFYNLFIEKNNDISFFLNSSSN